MADKFFDWSDVIENDNAFTLLPDGNYPFTVQKFERGEHGGSDKIPPCKKAVLTISVDGGELGDTEITDNLFLVGRFEWKLCQFFTAIGARKHGEQMRMNWNAVTGARGWCSVTTRKYNGKEFNQIAAYLDPAEAAKTAARPPQTATPPRTGFTPGAF